MKYFLLTILGGFFFALASPVSAAVKTHTYDVPSPVCVAVGNQPCSHTISPSSGPNTLNTGAENSTNGSPSTQPSTTQTISSAPSGSPSPSSTAPCATSQSSVSSQRDGSVSALSEHHDKRHYAGKQGYLQQFILFLWQLLQLIFNMLGIQLPNITTPCSSSASPSGTPSNGGAPSTAPSLGAGGGSGTGSGNPSPTVFGTSPAPSSSPSTQPGGSGSTGGGTTSSPGRFGIALGGGWQGYNSSQLNTYFADMASIGTQWVRFDIVWAEVQPNSGGSYNWSSFDNVAAAAKAHGLKVLGILDMAPSWAQQSSCAGQTWCPPNGTSNFAAFAAAAANHYAPLGVTTFEIWNEENTPTFWIGPNVANYTALLKASYTAIHNAQHSDFVVSGGVSPGAPGLIQPNTFVQQMYADGAKGYFDALGIHPYCFSDPITICTSTNTSNTDVWGQMAWGPNNIVSIMKANGDGSKKIWMTEFGDNNVSEAPQEMQNAFNNTNGQAWAGPIFWYDYTGDGSFGLVGTPAYNTYKQLAGK